VFSTHAEGDDEYYEHGKPGQAFVPIENFVATERYLQRRVNDWLLECACAG